MKEEDGVADDADRLFPSSNSGDEEDRGKRAGVEGCVVRLPPNPGSKFCLGLIGGVKGKKFCFKKNCKTVSHQASKFAVEGGSRVILVEDDKEGACGLRKPSVPDFAQGGGTRELTVLEVSGKKESVAVLTSLLQGCLDRIDDDSPSSEDSWVMPHETLRELKEKVKEFQTPAKRQTKL